MDETKTKSSGRGNILKQASFLVIAGIAVKIIGALYRSPLVAVIGETGSGYYGYAYTAYSILLMISSYSIPMAVSKVMAERVALKQYRNAQKIFKGSMLYVLIVGGIAAVITFFFARYLLPRGQENAVLALRVLAPAILLAGFLGVFRGYFQAHNNMIPTSLSQIVEQVANAVVSVGAAWYLTRAVQQDPTEVAIRGAAGGTLGTGVGVLTGLVFMFFVYHANKRKIFADLVRDPHDEVESYREVFKVIFLMVTPVIFSTCIYNISTYVDQTIFSNLMLSKGYASESIAGRYGIFSQQYMTLINIPVALASAVSTAIVPAVASSYSLGDKKGAMAKIDEGIRSTMFVAIPAAVGMGVLAIPLVKLVFPSTRDPYTAGIYVMMGAISIVFFCMSTVTNGVLQGIGKQMIPVRSAGIALCIDVVLLFTMLEFIPELDIVAVIICNVLYGMNVSMMNALALRKHLHYRNKIKSSYLIPLASAAVMGCVAWAVQWGISRILPESYASNAISVVCAVGAGVVVYAVLYIVLCRIPLSELKKIPGGKILLKLARKLRRNKGGTNE